MKLVGMMPLLLAVTAAILIGCGGSSPDGSTTTTATTTATTSTTATTGTTSGTTGTIVDVSMPNGTMSFSPQDTPAHPGDVVRWTNNDFFAHTIKPDVATPNMDSDPTFPTGMVAGNQFSWTVPANATTGTKFFYHCRFHGIAGNGTALGTGMVGVVTVQ